MKTDYDVITVGGGLGGSALAKVLAENGKRALVVEREVDFKDRVRGETLLPWGAAEARRIGLYDHLCRTCAREQPFLHMLGMGAPRDLRATTPQGLPSLNFYHPAMQEAVLESALKAGAEVWRGGTVRDIRPGTPPVAAVAYEGAVRNLTARLIVAADGRSSAARAWGGFTTRRGSQKLLGAGVLLENFAGAEDTGLFLLNPFVGRAAFLFPQNRGQARAYLIYGAELDRLQGERDNSRFIEESIKSGMPMETYAGVRPAGPLASFDMTETWVDHPYRNGLALLGDAAGSSDPTWGQGLSLTLRDVRVLTDNLLTEEDWDAAGHRYAVAHDHHFNVERTVGQWFFDLFLGRGEAADRRRERTFPLLMSEPERVPDHGVSGPDLPFHEDVRRRFFGEM
jgi:2-polyprenyl-6-methoxyphenol hydroxylase-like FAD-dependent oxidoreductase